MVEITLSKVIPFDNGFVIESSIKLVTGTTYYLSIDTNVIDKQYIVSYNRTTIIDNWANVGYTPINNSNVCFTLLDYPSGQCPPIQSSLQVT